MNNKDKIILDLCGGTGSWSRPYKEAGYDVRVITLPQYDVLEYIPPHGVYGVLAAPSCTMFSFARTNRKKNPTNFREAMKIVNACLRIIEECKHQAWESGSINSFKFWALENPRGYLRHFIGNPAFSFQPFEYGDHHSKQTDLWGMFNIPTKNPIELTQEQKRMGILNLRELPELPEDYVLPPGYDKRAARRAVTPPGFANAFFKANR